MSCLVLSCLVRRFNVSFYYSILVPRGLNFDIVIYREMVKKSSSQEPLGQFQPNLVGNMPRGWGFKLFI